MCAGGDPEAGPTGKISSFGSPLAQTGMAFVAVLGRRHLSVLACYRAILQLLLFRQHYVRRHSRGPRIDDADPQFRHDMPSHLRTSGSDLSGADILRHLSLASPDPELHGQLWYRVAIPSAARAAPVDSVRNPVLRLSRAALLAPAICFSATAGIGVARTPR